MASVAAEDTAAVFWLVLVVGDVAQWSNVGLWPANFPCPALDLQLMGDH